MTKERRKFVRLDASIDIKYKILKRGKWGETVTKNISGEGLRLAVKEEIPPASILLLEIKLPVYPPSITAKGIVIWSKKDEVGIKFIKINPVDQTRIFKYIYEHIY